MRYFERKNLKRFVSLLSVFVLVVGMLGSVVAESAKVNEGDLPAEPIDYIIVASNAKVYTEAGGKIQATYADGKPWTENKNTILGYYSTTSVDGVAWYLIKKKDIEKTYGWVSSKFVNIYKNGCVETVSSDTLRVRAEHNTSAEIVYNITASGEKFYYNSVYTDKINNMTWYRIQYDKKNGYYGWALGETLEATFLKCIDPTVVEPKPEPNTLPKNGKINVIVVPLTIRADHSFYAQSVGTIETVCEKEFEDVYVDSISNVTWYKLAGKEQWVAGNTVNGTKYVEISNIENFAEATPKPTALSANQVRIVIDSPINVHDNYDFNAPIIGSISGKGKVLVFTEHMIGIGGVNWWKVEYTKADGTTDYGWVAESMYTNGKVKLLETPKPTAETPAPTAAGLDAATAAQLADISALYPRDGGIGKVYIATNMINVYLGSNMNTKIDELNHTNSYDGLICDYYSIKTIDGRTWYNIGYYNASNTWITGWLTGNADQIILLDVEAGLYPHGQVRTKDSQVLIRAAAVVGSAPVRRIENKGEVLYYYGTTVANGYTWYKVQVPGVNNTYGWMRGDWLEVVGGTVTATPTSGTGRIRTLLNEALNVRKDHSTTSQALGQITSAGVEYNYYETYYDATAKVTWYKIMFNGQYGWVVSGNASKSFVSVVGTVTATPTSKVTATPAPTAVPQNGTVRTLLDENLFVRQDHSRTSTIIATGVITKKGVDYKFNAAYYDKDEDVTWFYIEYKSGQYGWVVSGSSGTNRVQYLSIVGGTVTPTPTATQTPVVTQTPGPTAIPQIGTVRTLLDENLFVRQDHSRTSTIIATGVINKKGVDYKFTAAYYDKTEDVTWYYIEYQAGKYGWVVSGSSGTNRVNYLTLVGSVTPTPTSIVTATPTATSVPTATPIPKIGRVRSVKNESLNVRDNHSYTGKIIGSITKSGEEYDFVDTYYDEGNKAIWYNIVFNGEYGWAVGNGTNGVYLEVVTNVTATPTPTATSKVTATPTVTPVITELPTSGRIRTVRDENLYVRDNHAMTGKVLYTVNQKNVEFDFVDVFYEYSASERIPWYYIEYTTGLYGWVKSKGADVVYVELVNDEPEDPEEIGDPIGYFYTTATGVNVRANHVDGATVVVSIGQGIKVPYYEIAGNNANSWYKVMYGPYEIVGWVKKGTYIEVANPPKGEMTYQGELIVTAIEGVKARVNANTSSYIIKNVPQEEILRYYYTMTDGNGVEWCYVALRPDEFAWVQKKYTSLYSDDDRPDPELDIFANWVSVPYALTEIEPQVFMGNLAITNMNLGSTKVSKIGSRAFAYCSNLKQIILPSKVTYIADDAFVGCEAGLVIFSTSAYVQEYANKHGIRCVNKY